MINFVICSHTQWEVFFQIKFHPRMKFTCKQNFFHPGMRLHLSYIYALLTKTFKFVLKVKVKICLKNK